MRNVGLKAAAGLVLVGAGVASRGQAIPTATAPLRVTAFVGVTGNFTGLELAKNLAVTGGVDFEVRPFFTLYPALEVRGSYPVAGVIDRQRNVLGGLRLARQSGPFHPYGDVLFGAGEIKYGNGGYLDPSRTFLYTSTYSNVYSLGGGVEIRVSERLAGKADFQLQRYLTPVVATNALYSKVFTVGAVYRFGFGGRIR